LRERGILSLDSNQQSAARLLKRSVALNAFEAEALIGLGLLAESGSHIDEAEAYLSRAASVSRRFKPQWALAFFYARRGAEDRFWKAASVAANVESADAQPVFRLAHQVLKDPERVADSLQLKSQHALTSYLGFLLKQQGSAGLSSVALRLEPNPESRPVLLAAVDRLINQNRTDDAVRLWNRLNRSRRNRQLAAATGTSLTNGLFEAAEGRGFEWRYAANQGIGLRAGAPGDLRLEFSGHQSESATLLDQFVPVIPGRSYRLSFAYATAGLSGPTGLYWQVFQATTPLSPPSDPLNPVPEGAGTLAFQTGPGVELVRLVLRYARSPGTMRLEGIVTLRSAELELL
jgi:hypothetical protein